MPQIPLRLLLWLLPYPNIPAVPRGVYRAVCVACVGAGDVVVGDFRHCFSLLLLALVLPCEIQTPHLFCKQLLDLHKYILLVYSLDK